jgi:tripartite-type tricarboxylate transporter receptor subunit TctC
VSRVRLGAILVLALSLASAPAWAQSEMDYKGKTLHLTLSTGVGGGYDSYARTFARYVPNYLTGHPNAIVENMPGAGGIKAANWLYLQAPKDGTTLGFIQVTNQFAPLLGNKAAQYDPTKFNWLGSMDQNPAICVAWHDSPIQTWQDMLSREFTVGGTGAGSSMIIYPSLLNRLFGAKFKTIAGYRDAGSVMLAIERGEVEGLCGPFLTSIKATQPSWLTEKKIVLPVVLARTRLAEFPDSPSIAEFFTDDTTRQVFELIFASGIAQRPMLAPPDVPAPVVKQLRAAFVATLTDPGFRSDADKQHLTIDFVDGDVLADTIRKVYAMLPDALEIAKQAMGNAAE